MDLVGGVEPDFHNGTNSGENGSNDQVLTPELVSGFALK
jgi:hypothetical protein